MSPHYTGLEHTLQAIRDLRPVGLVGFSQGAAMAALVECDWVALFSPVKAPGLNQRFIPSFHCYDPNEEFASQCVDVFDLFTDKEVHTHCAGHTIPSDKALVACFAAFVSKNTCPNIASVT